MHEPLYAIVALTQPASQLRMRVTSIKSETATLLSHSSGSG